jgi:hypothetical protein
MTMSLVRGMTSLNTKKQKSKKKTAKQIAAEAEHEANAKGERVGINAIPNYKVVRVTSDIIPAHGSAKERSQYTGTEIAGIVTTHKSNAQPIRKDNKQAAVDAANMRR